MTRSDEDYEQAMINWAQGYQGYERIAADSEHLQAVYGSIMDETVLQYFRTALVYSGRART